MQLICKLFGFILDLFTAAVNTVGIALSTVGTVLLEVIGDVAGAASNALFGGGLGQLLVLGGAGYLLFLATKDNKDKKHQEKLARIQAEASLRSGPTNNMGDDV